MLLIPPLSRGPDTDASDLRAREVMQMDQAKLQSPQLQHTLDSRVNDARKHYTQHMRELSRPGTTTQRGKEHVIGACLEEYAI